MISQSIFKYKFKSLSPRSALENEIEKSFKESNSAISKYILSSTLGKVLYDKNKDDPKSYKWLTIAINCNVIDQNDYIETLLYGASATSTIDSSKSVIYCLKAVELASNKINYDELDYILLLGELALAYWINNDNINSFQTFEKAVTMLFESRTKNFGSYWIRLFSWTGHSLGYISSVATTGNPPEKDGEYFKPFQGLYTFNNKDLSDIYNPLNDSLILAQLAMFSDGINNIPKTYTWSLKAFDHARKNKDQQKIVMIYIIAGQYSLINYKIEEAIEAITLFAIVSVSVEGEARQKFKHLNELDLEKLYNDKPSPSWDKAEDTVLLYGIIPMLILLLKDSFEKNKNVNQHIDNFLSYINKYNTRVSAKTTHETAEVLIRRILKKEIREVELFNLTNKFEEIDNKNLQIISILGIIFISKDSYQVIQQIFNIFPYFCKTFTSSNSTIKFIIVPFLKVRAIKILEADFIGTKLELEYLKSQVEAISASDPNAMQLILQLIVKQLEIKITESKKPWLYDFKNF